MPDIGQAIYGRLSGDATLSGLLNGGIYPYTPKELPQRPYITYHLINQSERPHAMGSDPSLVVDRYQIDLWADTYADMIAIDDEVQRLLSRWRGSDSGVNVNAVYYTDRRDLYEDEPELFRRSVDYTVAWYE